MSTPGLKQYGDAFSDVESDLSGFGSLAGAAMNRHERVESKVLREGVHLHAPCDNCGAHNVIIADWPEVIFIAEGKIPPTGWRFEKGYIRTAIGCRGCNREMPVGVTPEEAGKWVNAGMRAQYLQQQYVQGVAAQARGVR